MRTNYFSRLCDLKSDNRRISCRFFAIANVDRSSLELRFPDNYRIAVVRELLCIRIGMVSLALGHSRRQNSHNEAQTPRK